MQILVVLTRAVPPLTPIPHYRELARSCDRDPRWQLERRFASRGGAVRAAGALPGHQLCQGWNAEARLVGPRGRAQRFMANGGRLLLRGQARRCWQVCVPGDVPEKIS